MSDNDTLFNLHNTALGIARELGPGINTRIFPGDHAMLSVVTIDANAEGKIHHHPEEQWGVLLDGSLTRYQGDKAFPVKKGDFWVSPGGIEHGVIGRPDGAVILDVFSPPREEYTRPGSGFGTE